MNKFKVGDKVRVLKHEYSPSTGGMGYWGENSEKAVGVVSNITSIEKDGICWVGCGMQDEHPYLGAYKPEELELVGGELKAKFKVGDRVRSRQPVCKYTGTIERIEKDFAIVHTDNGSSWGCKVLENGSIATALGLWDDKSLLEKIDEEAPHDSEEDESPYKFKCDWISDPIPLWLMDKPKPKTKTTLKEVRSMLSILAKKLLDSDVKALVQSGYLDSELEVTEKGQQAVYAMFFEQNKVALAKQARAELKKAKREEE